MPEHGSGHCSSIAHAVTVLERPLTWFWPRPSSTSQAVPVSTFWISMDQGQFLEGRSSPARTQAMPGQWVPMDGGAISIVSRSCLPFELPLWVQVPLGGGRVVFLPHGLEETVLRDDAWFAHKLKHYDYSVLINFPLQTNVPVMGDTLGLLKPRTPNVQSCIFTKVRSRWALAPCRLSGLVAAPHLFVPPQDRKCVPN